MMPSLQRSGAVLTAVLLLAACGRGALPPEPARSVLTTVLGAQAGSDTPSYSGEVRSRYETQLAFRVAGKISERLVDAGAQVKAGDVLARLDPVDMALTAASAKAELELAEADVRRYRELRAKNFVSQAALDGKETALKANKAKADLAGNQSAYATLRADQPGVVSQVVAEVGQVVAPGQVVMRMARTDALEVAVAIPEARMPEVRKLEAAEVSLWADPQAKYKGVLRELSQVADSATRTYAARVSILRPDAKLLLGMSAQVRFADEKASAASALLSIPLTAVFQQEGKPALWVVGADETISLRPIVIARFDEDKALVASGASAGERIVVAGVHKLTAGEKIKAIDQASAVSGSSDTALAK